MSAPGPAEAAEMKAEEHDANDDLPAENSNFGKDRLAEKAADLEELKANSMDAEKFQQLAKEASAELRKELKSTAKQLVSSLTPGFIQRMMSKKIHSERIVKQISSNTYAKEDIAKKLVEVKKATKKAKKDAKKLRAAIQKRGVDQIGAVEEKKQFKAAEAKKLEDDYIARRDAQLSEVQAVIDKKVREMKEEEARNLLEKRKYNLKHWTQVAHDAHLEAVETNKRVHVEKTRSYRKQMDNLYDEWADRDVSRLQMQVEGPSLSAPIGLPGGELGIFGVPMGDGEYHGRFEGAGHRAGLDDHDVHVFDAAPNTEYEDNNIKLNDSVSEQLRKQALYDSLNGNSRELSTALDRLVQMRDLAEKDEFQVRQEMLVTQTDQIGPPRRAPHNHEIEPTHIRKQRALDLNNKIRELQHCIDVAELEKRKTDGQILGLSRELAALKEKNKVAQGELDSVNRGLGNLPMVIGRSIAKMAGMDITAKPKELLNAIRQQSKLVETGKMVQFAIKTHRERNELDQQLWVAKQSGNETKSEANHVVNRLAEISEKMHTQYLTAQKRNIIEALNVFLFRQIKLKPMNTKLSGLCPWFVHRDEHLSRNIAPFKSSSSMGGLVFEIDPEMHNEEMEKMWSNGVTLGESHAGFCVGMIELPKSSMWSVLATISRQGRGPAYDHEDESDRVTISLGGSLGTLTKCLICQNRVNPLTGSVLYDVNFIFRGDFLAYRFDFMSSTTDVKKHMAVSVGLYEEYEIKGVEVNEDQSGGQRVLSSYVKILRLNQQQGKFRETKLLEELIAIEDNLVAKFWDSDIVSHTPQRYSRDYFLRILKAEILLEQRTGNAALMQVLDQRAKVATKLQQKKSKTEQTLERSRDDFTSRKRTKQSHVLTAGKALVNKRIEIYDPTLNIWRHVLIRECVVRWLDNGLTAKCTYYVHEHNAGFELLGVPFEVDLDRVRWFESAIQELDESQMLKWRRARNFEKRLNEIQLAIDSKVLEFRTSYENFRTAEEDALRKHTSKTLKKMEKHVDNMAVAKADSWQGQREIKQGVPSVLLDMKCGVVEIDTSVKPGIQAAKESRRRWIVNWIKEKRQSVMDDLFLREKAVEERINRRRLLFIDLEKGVIDLAAAEKYSLVAQVKEYQKTEKQKLMKRVKFDPAKFALAVPNAHACTHQQTKAWGDKYGKGIRCKSCGKELSNIDEEASQMLGYGTGTPEELWEAIKRHRSDEAAFKFKNSTELALVESERLRMEKERRVMEEEEAFFYDFMDLRAVYDFDRRHAKHIKGAGIFRQGLQWTEEELRAFEVDMRYKEIERIKKGNLVDTLIDKFDALNCIEEPPPTFRGMDEKRRANYDEFMFMMGRLHTYQKKIAFLKEVRLDLLSERAIYSIVLEFLHKESYGYDQELDKIEKDLDKTNLLLSTFDRMQALWKSATRIMNQAKKDKLRAELKQCGVWDDVKEALEKASFLHDETLNLLKVKFTFDNQKEGKERVFHEQKNQLADTRQKLEELQLASTRMAYCRPGDLVMTRYGDGIIRFYRKRDDMLLISLSFGEPLATLWIHASEIVAAERARQQGERFLMGIDDERASRFYRAERISSKKERWAMAREEEGLKSYYQFIDLGARQQDVALEAINKAVVDKYVVFSTANFQKSLNKSVDAKLDVQVRRQKQLFGDYHGPQAGKPKKPTFFWIYETRKEIVRELQTKFLISSAGKAERDAHANFEAVRSNWLQTLSFSLLIEDTVLDMIKETAKETYHEGKMAKKSAERLSGLIFPNPKTMQYDAYKSLVEVWKHRKSDLRVRIEINRGVSSKISRQQAKENMNEEEMMEVKAVLRKERQERLRQKAICDVMEADEIRTKAFYQWELKVNLVERRLMKAEENAMRNFVKDEIKAKLKAEQERKAGYLVSDKLAAEAAKKKQKEGASFADRRIMLAEEILAKRRQEEDWAFMILEDAAGQPLRELDMKERTLRKLAKTLGLTEEELRAQNGVSSALGGDDMFVEIPDWFEPDDVPDNWEDWPPVKQRKYVEEKSNIRDRKMNIERNIEIANMRLDKIEDVSYDSWRELYSVLEQEEMETELKYMNMFEVSRQYEHDLLELENNIHRILTFCREKGEEELRAKSVWRQKQAIARKRDKELADAKAWLDLCSHRARQRDKIKRKVVENCLWIDTDSVTGFHQRFKTELLRERLYWSYFRRILASIITRAEIIASERRMMAIQEQLSQNKAVLVERTAQMKERWHDIQRDEYMRMRKSVLNQKFFPNHRRETLHQRFSSWVRFFLWNRGHREAFELKYELIKRQMDVDRQYKEQLKKQKAKEESDHLLSTHADRRKLGLGPTTLQAHREHVVACEDCKVFYLESQNHSMACKFHTAKFAMHCPRDCPSPGLTAKCSSHRIKRWTCCDSVKAEAVGCSRKYHQPRAVDFVYDKMMSKIIARDLSESVELDKKLTVARKENWGLQEMQMKRGQLQVLEDAIQVDRDQAARFDSIKFQ